MEVKYHFETAVTKIQIPKDRVSDSGRIYSCNSRVNIELLPDAPA